jgi:hypothetical protein
LINSPTFLFTFSLYAAASENGGAISSQQFAHIAINSSTFSSNHAMDGAVVGLKDNSSAVLEAGVRLRGNVVEKSGGGLAAEGSTQVRLQCMTTCSGCGIGVTRSHHSALCGAASPLA